MYNIQNLYGAISKLKSFVRNKMNSYEDDVFNIFLIFFTNKSKLDREKDDQSNKIKSLENEINVLINYILIISN